VGKSYFNAAPQKFTNSRTSNIYNEKRLILNSVVVMLFTVTKYDSLLNIYFHFSIGLVILSRIVVTEFISYSLVLNQVNSISRGWNICENNT
jgi:hypothetical protein